MSGRSIPTPSEPIAPKPVENAPTPPQSPPLPPPPSYPIFPLAITGNAVEAEQIIVPDINSDG